MTSQGHFCQLADEETQVQREGSERGRRGQ